MCKRMEKRNASVDGELARFSTSAAVLVPPSPVVSMYMYRRLTTRLTPTNDERNYAAP